MGLSFTIAAGPRQRSHSQVILRDSWPHFTASDLRLPNLEGLVPVFISPRSRVARLYPQVQASFFIASFESQGYGGGIRPRLHAGGHPTLKSKSNQSQSYDTTDGQSASLSWNKAPIWILRPDFYYCQTIAGFVDMGRPLCLVQYIYILHVITWMYIQYIQGLSQSRLSTADHVLSLVASAYEF
jgi:hypothetical protein